MQNLINRALVDHYRCAEDLAEFKLTGALSSDTGYFRFGQNTIYGRSASGFRASRADSVLYDVVRDVGCVVLSDHPKPATDYHLKTGQRE